jgi:hypothetical protein
MSQPATENTDSFANLLLPCLCADTYAFLDVYRGGIQRTKESERIQALTRFEVSEMHGNKYSEEFWEHEFATVVVIDTITNNKYTFYFERNAASSQKGPELRVSFSSNLQHHDVLNLY